MRVGPVCHVFSRETVNALRTCIAAKVLPNEAFPTAVFCEQVGRWFEYINNRNPQCALWQEHKQENETTYKFLEQFMRAITQGSFEGSFDVDRWKPVHRGLVVTTQSIISLSQSLLDEGATVIYTHN